MSILLMGIKAQDILNVKNISGSSSFYTNNIRKLTFPDDNLNVVELDGASSAYAISNVRKFDFSGISTQIQIPQEPQQSGDDIQLYPNPVNDVLYVKNNSIEKYNLKFEIFDIQGKLLKVVEQQSINSINVSDLRKGMYICRVHTCKKIEIIKFLKK
jgi:hypothetical protein